MKPRSKHAGNGSSEPAFIRPLECDGEQVQVSFRVAASEKMRFDAAQSTLRSHGKEMPLAEVLRAAMREAAEYVEQRYGGPSKLGKCDAENRRDSDPVATKKSVEHSSIGPVEEWGADEKNSASSTRPEATTPQGSRSTQRVERGGGFDSENEAHDLSEATNG